MGAGIRRVVTGLDGDGRSCVALDESVTTAYELPSRGGLSLASLLEVPMPPGGPSDGGDASMPLAMIPGPGFARVIRAVHPPETAGGTHADGDPAVPGRGDWFDAGRGWHMHQTPTIDVIVVSSGSIDLLLEAGRVTLREGDVVVQRATWHAWENPYAEPCVLIGVNFPYGDAPGAHP